MINVEGLFVVYILLIFLNFIILLYFGMELIDYKK